MTERRCLCPDLPFFRAAFHHPDRLAKSTAVGRDAGKKITQVINTEQTYKHVEAAANPLCQQAAPTGRLTGT